VYLGEQLADIYIAPTLIKLEPNKIGGNPVLPIDQKMFTEDIYKKFDHLTY
jgi:hypothetical protein